MKIRQLRKCDEFADGNFPNTRAHIELSRVLEHKSNYHIPKIVLLSNRALLNWQSINIWELGALALRV